MKRFGILLVVLIGFVVVPFLIWGDTLTALFSPDSTGSLFAAGGEYMWLFAIALLVADIFIPIPTTSIIAALGIVYGPILGGGIAVGGTVLAASAGYAIGRLLGRPFAVRFVGEGLAAGEATFAKHGALIVAASRWMPVLPEVVSVVAGNSRLPFARFNMAVLIGVIPFCFAFATVGHLGAEAPVMTLIASALVPFLLWWVARKRGLLGLYQPA